MMWKLDNEELRIGRRWTVDIEDVEDSKAEVFLTLNDKRSMLETVCQG